MTNSITLDKLASGNFNESITYIGKPALGDGEVIINGNLLSGKIKVHTGNGSTGYFPARIVFPEDSFDTDNLFINIFSCDDRFFDVKASEVSKDGFNIISKDLWDDQDIYEFKYLIVSNKDLPEE